MFVDLHAAIDRENVDHFGIAVHGEQDAPAANAGLSDSGPVGEGSRQARIEGVIGKLYKASPNTTFQRPVDAIKNLFGLASNANSKTHKPRSRSYSARGFTRPAATSARPRPKEASASGSRGGPSSAASWRSWSHPCASFAWSSGSSSGSLWSASRVVILVPFHDNSGASWATVSVGIKGQHLRRFCSRGGWPHWRERGIHSTQDSKFSLALPWCRRYHQACANWSSSRGRTFGRARCS